MYKLKKIKILQVIINLKKYKKVSININLLSEAQRTAHFMNLWNNLTRV